MYCVKEYVNRTVLLLGLLLVAGSQCAFQTVAGDIDIAPECPPSSLRCHVVTNASAGADTGADGPATVLVDGAIVERCLKGSLLCDGVKNCVGGEDEVHCCPQGQFRCPTPASGARAKPICIPASHICDGVVDCPLPGGDEGPVTCGTQGSSHVCPQEGEVMLSSNCCVAEDVVCDGHPDCLDGSDEKECNCETPLPKQHLQQLLFCSNKTTVVFRMVYDKSAHSLKVGKRWSSVRTVPQYLHRGARLAVVPAAATTTGAAAASCCYRRAWRHGQVLLVAVPLQYVRPQSSGNPAGRDAATATDGASQRRRSAADGTSTTLGEGTPYTIAVPCSASIVFPWQHGILYDIKRMSRQCQQPSK